MSKESLNIVHESVRLAQQGLNPTVITRVKSGWVVLGDNQVIPGYCILLADPIVDNINKLQANERKQFLHDMTIIGDALINVMDANLINYSILGNLDAGLHAHVHPRYSSEPDEYRKAPPWRYNFMKVPAVEFNPEKDRLLMQRLKDEIDKLSAM
ncbi:MAG: HIT family protein [Bacteroidales bacterium]